MDVFFIDAFKGWTVGMQGTILSTTNGGINWNFQSSNVTNWLEGVVFLDENRGYVIGNDIILFTADGGLSWYHNTHRYRWFEDIYFVDRWHGWAIGVRGAYQSKTIYDDGTIKRNISSGNSIVWETTDGGTNWSEFNFPINSWLIYSIFTDLNNGWAVGENGTILKYINTFPIPTPPSDLAATVVSENEVNITWSDNSDNEDGFYLYRSDGVSGVYTVLDSLDANVTSYSDKKLSNNNLYWYRVDAFNTAGKSAKSLDVLVTITMNVPTDLNAVAVSYNQINLSWTDNTSLETGYIIERKLETDSSYSILDSVDVNISSYQDSTLEEGTTYYYRVQGYNTTATSAYSNYAHATTLTELPAIPTLISPVNGAINLDTTLTLEWDSSSHVKFYHLQVATDAHFITKFVDDSLLTSTFFQPGPLAHNTTYYWHVKAKNIAGMSDWSSVWSFTTIIAAPSVPTLATPTNGAVNQPKTLTLTWNPSTDAETYHLQVSTDVTFTTTVADDSSITTTFQQVGPLTDGTTYYWRVSATNASGTSLFSAIWSFTTEEGDSPLWILQPSGTTQGLHEISFADANKGTIIGQVGTILYTCDEGINWTQQSSGVTNWLYDVSFIDPENGTAVGHEGIILRTTDSGTTWNQQISGTTRSLRGVSFVDDKTGIIVGDYGTILQTTDGGETWISQNNGIQNDLADITFINVNEAIVVGSSGIILRTTDGGITWTPKYSGTTSYLSGISFGDEVSGTVVGGGGTILHTTNGGETWSHQNSGVENFLLDVSFFNANIGTSVGQKGTILYTANGGETWTRESSGTSIDLLGVAQINSITTIAVGYTGTILRKTTNVDTITSPQLISPLDGSIGIAINPTLIWNFSTGATSFQLQVSTNSDFSDTIIDQSGITEASYSINGLSINTIYYWRVKAINSGGGSDWSSVWSFKTGTTALNYKCKEILTRFSISQNYPNPFNLSTTIRYALPKTVYVKITVFDPLGKEVETLVNGVQVAGEYEINWNPNNLTSGVYVYRLQADQFEEAKKLIIMK